MKSLRLLFAAGVMLSNSLADVVERAVGEWNAFEVTCSKGTIATLVDLTETNEATGCSLTSGRIGILSEGATLEVRHIMIEPLRP